MLYDAASKKFHKESPGKKLYWREIQLITWGQMKNYFTVLLKVDPIPEIRIAYCI
jgi:hypothetical protein